MGGSTTGTSSSGSLGDVVAAELVVAATVAVLMATGWCLEALEHRLRGEVEGELLRAMFRELTAAGLASFALFAVKAIPAIAQSLSAEVLHDIEIAHLLVAATAVAHAIFVLAIVALSFRMSAQWAQWEKELVPFHRWRDMKMRLLELQSRISVEVLSPFQRDGIVDASQAAERLRVDRLKLDERSLSCCESFGRCLCCGPTSSTPFEKHLPPTTRRWWRLRCSVARLCCWNPCLVVRYQSLLARVRFVEMRHWFLRELRLSPDFRFSDYLRRAKAATVKELVRVPPVLWASLVLGVLVDALLRESFRSVWKYVTPQIVSLTIASVVCVTVVAVTEATHLTFWKAMHGPGGRALTDERRLLISSEWKMALRVRQFQKGPPSERGIAVPRKEPSDLRRAVAMRALGGGDETAQLRVRRPGRRDPFTPVTPPSMGGVEVVSAPRSGSTLAVVRGSESFRIRAQPVLSSGVPSESALTGSHHRSHAAYLHSLKSEGLSCAVCCAPKVTVDKTPRQHKRATCASLCRGCVARPLTLPWRTGLLPLLLQTCVFLTAVLGAIALRVDAESQADKDLHQTTNIAMWSLTALVVLVQVVTLPRAIPWLVLALHARDSKHAHEEPHWHGTPLPHLLRYRSPKSAELPHTVNDDEDQHPDESDDVPDTPRTPSEGPHRHHDGSRPYLDARLPLVRATLELQTKRVSADARKVLVQLYRDQLQRVFGPPDAKDRVFAYLHTTTMEVFVGLSVLVFAAIALIRAREDAAESWWPLWGVQMVLVVLWTVELALKAWLLGPLRFVGGAHGPHRSFDTMVVIACVALLSWEASEWVGHNAAHSPVMARAGAIVLLRLLRTLGILGEIWIDEGEQQAAEGLWLRKRVLQLPPTITPSSSPKASDAPLSTHVKPPISVGRSGSTPSLPPQGGRSIEVSERRASHSDVSRTESLQRKRSLLQELFQFGDAIDSGQAVAPERMSVFTQTAELDDPVLVHTPLEHAHSAPQDQHSGSTGRSPLSEHHHSVRRASSTRAHPAMATANMARAGVQAARRAHEDVVSRSKRNVAAARLAASHSTNLLKGGDGLSVLETVMDADGDSDDGSSDGSLADEDTFAVEIHS
jgi:hypothetical protein